MSWDWVVGLGGFATGVVVGVAFRDALDLITQREKLMSRNAVRRTVGWIGANLSVLVLIIVAGLQAIVGVLLITTRADVAETSQCQAAYNQTFSEAYRARLGSADVSRNKQFRVWQSVDDLMDPDVRQDAQARQRKVAEFQRRLEDYIAANEAYERERRVNPLPPLPDTFCER